MSKAGADIDKIVRENSPFQESYDGELDQWGKAINEFFSNNENQFHNK